MGYHTVPGKAQALESVFRDVSKLQALHAEPAFPPYRKAAIPSIEKTHEAFNVEEVYMRPTDYSPMR